ncbi:MAG: benzylsuccinate CoA-transferase BbsE subunit [Acidimicrobiia bacterium]|nr:benzylsuccinate CoA-transferase BbsE subunit [Acidimicrobiia bacterium]
MSGPLQGTRVIDLAGLPAAYGTMLLAGLGADVVKVEPPAGDSLRRLPPFLDAVEPPENSLWFAYLGQGKRSVVIDYEQAEGRRRLEQLISTADVVVESSAPGTWDGVRQGNPQVVWASVTPFGQTGPRRSWQGSNLVAWASSGVLYVTGFPHSPPVTPAGPVQLACQLAALNTAASVMLALRARAAHPEGKGQLVDISMQECCLAISPETGAPLFLDDLVHRNRLGNRRDVSSPFGLYPCKDGHVSFLVLQPAHWLAMATWIQDVTGNDIFLEETFYDIAMRAQTKDLVDEWTEAVTKEFTKLELFQEGQRRGIPVTPVNTVADLAVDPHLEAVSFFEPTDHPKLGPFLRPGAPFRDNHGWWSLSRAPLLGEHTAEVL